MSDTIHGHVDMIAALVARILDLIASLFTRDGERQVVELRPQPAVIAIIRTLLAEIQEHIMAVSLMLGGPPPEAA